jgi:hypothetical protein
MTMASTHPFHGLLIDDKDNFFAHTYHRGFYSFVQEVIGQNSMEASRISFDLIGGIPKIRVVGNFRTARK